MVICVANMSLFALQIQGKLALDNFKSHHAWQTIFFRAFLELTLWSTLSWGQFAGLTWKLAWLGRSPCLFPSPFTSFLPMYSCSSTRYTVASNLLLDLFIRPRICESSRLPQAHCRSASGSPWRWYRMFAGCWYIFRELFQLHQDHHLIGRCQGLTTPACTSLRLD